MGKVVASFRPLLIAVTLFTSVLVLSADAPEPAVALVSDPVLEEAIRQREDALAYFLETHERVRQLGATPEKGARSAYEGKIVNGVISSEFPAVGALLKGASVEGMQPHCTGTLIGCSTFLTARHCLNSSTKPGQVTGRDEYSKYRVFFQHGGIFEVSDIRAHRDYKYPYADLAVVTLAKAVSGIDSVRLNTDYDVPLGTAGVIVGYGRSGGLRRDYGLKRSGHVTTSACSLKAKSLLCWDFDSAGAPGESSNTCNVDSGGPLLVEHPDAPIPIAMLAGVTSGGLRADCLLSDNSSDVDVRAFSSWIDEQTSDDLGVQACPGAPAIAASGSFWQGFSGKLDAGTTTALGYLEVPEGASILRLSMNAEDTGGVGEMDFDLSVGPFSPPTQTGRQDAACTNAGHQFTYCEFPSPAPGRWYFLVKRVKGAGLYQVTATVLRP